MDKVIHIWFVTRLASLWWPLSWLSALYCYYKNMVLRFLWYRLVFDYLVWKFATFYAALTHRDKQKNHFICDCHSQEWVYYVDTMRNGFKVCVISFGFNWTHYNDCIHLPRNNTQQLTTSSLEITYLISSSNHWT